MKKRNDLDMAPPVTGGSSLLVIFSVLCLTIFALLMLQTSQNSLRTAQTSRKAVEAYYEADCRAEEILAEIRMGELPEGVTREKTPEGDFYAYSCLVSDTQVLKVEVRLQGKEYEILTWKCISTVEAEEKQMMDLWEGDPVTDLGI